MCDAAPTQSSPGGLATGGRRACAPACGLATGGRPASGHASSASEKAQCKAELSRRRTEAAIEFGHLRAQAPFPVTRLQWAEWLEENLIEFRKRMPNGEAPFRRRHLNVRVARMQDLPPQGGRLQPTREHRRASTEWAKLLEWRTGWHGLEFRTGWRLFFLTHSLRRTYVLDLEDYHVGIRASPYVLGRSFKIEKKMFLNEFEPQFEGEVVLGVYKLTMEAVAIASQGLALKPMYTSKIVKPMKLKEEKKEKNKDKANTSDIDSQIDSCEDLGDNKMSSDLEENVPPAVDTDSDIQSFDDSGVSVTPSDESSDFESQPHRGCLRRRRACRGACLRRPWPCLRRPFLRWPCPGRPPGC